MRLPEDMNNDLDDPLRKALRPVDPEKGFADRVLARIEATPAARSRWLPQRFRAWPVALAASAVLGAVLIHVWQVDRERRGLEARRQLIEALHVTGEKLDLVYRSVKRESSPSSSDDAGA
jgi:hypothetical protein